MVQQPKPQGGGSNKKDNATYDYYRIDDIV